MDAQGQGVASSHPALTELRMATAKTSASDSQTVSIDRHRIKLTHLDKVLYPQTGTTKGEVIAYYAAVAEVMLPHVRDRAATRKRWVNGVGTEKKPGMMFFQKNLDESTPSWVKRRSIEHKDHSNEYPLVNDLATLTWLAQIAALEIHVPQWRFGRTGVPRNPDRFVLDLDPGPGVGLVECAEVARIARDILKGMGLDAMPVTSGSKGVHLYATLDGKQTSDEVTAVAHELARSLEADHPDLVVSDMKKSLRDGKVLVDWSQNNGNKTTVAPYSLRGRMRPMVAAPRTWRELESPSLDQLDFTEVMKRVTKSGDVLGGMDRLSTYRSKRDATRTPEPVPAGRAAASAGRSFVIQEHHASRLHWDFRLEHDGVLVSWALPKGVPTDYAKNHLAVQTEDHPLEYGTFEGDIPKGEYGGGHVDIWDEGTYELEKWRDGREVIATLHGSKHGSHKYALIHTGGEGKADRNWLIHLMKDQS
jgi:bifunctional non-homologous end joining protein LigD